MAKQITTDYNETLSMIIRGILKVSDAVGVTIGPKGRNVIIEKSYGSPLITNDGVTVAKEIELEDKFEQMGAKLAIDVASKTNDSAGDGTTTATILLSKMVTEGYKYVSAGMDPNELERGIDKATKIAIEAIRKSAKQLKTKEEIAHVATISAGNHEEIGNKIADISEKVGSEGIIKVEDSKTMETTTEVVEGMQIDQGYTSPYFVTDTQRMRAIYNNIPILITNKKISSVKELLPLLEKLSASGKKELAIIAEEVDGDALATLVLNKLRGIFNSIVIKAPGFGDRREQMLEDIAILTGGIMINDKLGIKLENIELADLGIADIDSSKDKTIIVSKKGDKQKLENRIEQIKSEIKESDSEWDREKLQERLARLAGGIGVIYVGASTEIEQKEKKLRVEDAVNAVKAARVAGIVPGGGTSLLLASTELMKEQKSESLEEKAGREIVARALEAPIRKIVENAGNDGGVVVNKIREKGDNFGFNAKTNKYVDDMFTEGIIDPALVSIEGITYVSSTVRTLLTAQVAIVDKPSEKESAPAMPDMGGMY